MKQNEKRDWYDRGYKLGVIETQRDAKAPRILGYWLCVALTVWEPVVAVVYLGIYTVWEYTYYKREQAKSEHQRKHYLPGKKFNWGTSMDGESDD